MTAPSTAAQAPLVPAPRQSALAPAGPDAALIDQLGWTMTVGACVILAGVMYLVVRALRARGTVATHAWIVGGGLLLPLVILTALLAWSLASTASLSRPSSLNGLRVAVTAKMWWWEVRYTDPATGRDIVLANEIRIPAGRPVYLALTTSDVIHSFWVPALAGKVDMVPGRVHGLMLQADRPGTWRGQCAEFCGTQHAKMALHVVAQPQAEFDAWLAGQARPAPAPATAQLARGRQAFLERRCAACHVVRGVTDGAADDALAVATTRVTTGPDLTHVGSRLYLAAGTLPTHQGTLAGWIADPQSHKPGVRMPAVSGLEGDELRALAAWLESLK
ncbi:cytochrome c oxidase subunit II [Pseudoduganella albidiflava]|uniref:Cytochrome aa3 subunit 2 n=1 Tax=Pseudoduganella albidiflava TaxID=321983 RepID=A0A411WXW7_9BURK|nr:cytochrome c oxidase subunit II [Pseudoduganella albidiflava]QBI01540.1 cytochrome c oxidase subunit II [Pseudoduganella albidiflava]GGY34913.1 cytochrome c oxidase subunit II [Pseudoduganella albidiflava]